MRSQTRYRIQRILFWFLKPGIHLFVWFVEAIGPTVDEVQREREEKKKGKK